MSAAESQGISSRAAAVPPSATIEISTLAAQLRAAGEPVVGYGAGEPDFPTPEYIVAAAQEAAADSRNHHYTPAGGLPDLREAVAAKTQRDSGYEVTPQQVVIANGGKHALYGACQALLDPGDEVLLPAPYWVSYPEMVRLAGATPVVLPTSAADGFEVTVDQLERARTAHTKMLIFVSPSNPTGAVYSAEKIREIGEWAVQHGIWVLTDEIYEHLVYGTASFASLPVEVPEVAERCVVINGVAKSYAMTGWRVGWLIAPPEVASAAIRLQSHMTSNVSNIAQRAALAAVTGSLDAVHQMHNAFDARRRTMYEMLRVIDGIECIEPHGAFYAFPSMEGLLGRDLGGQMAATSLELAGLVLEQIKVAFVPGEAFGAPGYARFSFALGADDLVEGLERLTALCGTRA
jgi:aspartate/methionine/tyrosine aminotransferase